jgi:ABC-type multidrug transport system ATPase subunit
VSPRPADLPLLTLRGFGFTYPDRTEALRGLDLTVEPGEIVGVMGPNGSGKTTLLRALACRGMRGGDSGGAPLPRVSLALDRPVFRRWLSGRENARFLLELGGVPKREAEGRVDLWLEAFDLISQAERPTSAYSRGTLHRLGLAVAFAEGAPLLLLDEPLAGLDPANRVRVERALDTARRAGRGVLLATHEPEFAEAACDRVAFMVDGSLRAIDRPDALLATMGRGTLVEIRVAGGEAPSPARLGEAPETVRRVSVAGAEITLLAEDAAAELPDLIKWIQASGCAISSLEVRRPGLRDAFFAITGEKWVARA